jgi:hypothetical protein
MRVSNKNHPMYAQDRPIYHAAMAKTRLAYLQVGPPQHGICRYREMTAIVREAAAV